jgi:hypothetical protein
MSRYLLAVSLACAPTLLAAQAPRPPAPAVPKIPV